MEFFRIYWKSKKGTVGMWVLSCLIFGLIFFLYGLPSEAVLYPTLICIVFLIGFVVRDVYRTKKKHQELCRLRELSAELLETVFEEPNSVEEADYQDMIRKLCREQRESKEQMNRRYGDMIEYYTIWAHQIKTPIASMRLNLQKEDSRLSRRLNADLFRIEQYVEMVLMFLRLDSDSTDYVFRKCELDTIIKDAVKKFASEFIGRRIRLVYEPFHVQVVTDEKWLAFVIEQVLSNALKYTSSGSITITVEDQQTLCIRDTGIGIAPEDLPRIFEKGYTGYNGRDDKKASGIGLYLCRRICNNLGHTIWAESVPDEGTAVYIRLDHEKTIFE